MKTAAALTLILAILGVAFAFVPCLGWMNWIAVPFCLVPMILGTIGLITDKDPNTGRNPNTSLYIACVIVPVLLGGGGALRCLLGGGVV